MPNEPALVSITVSNSLFLFLIFPLKGSLLRKVLLLLASNIVGLAWYLMQLSLRVASAYYLEADAFEALYVLIGSIIDLIWVVSVWSLSLSVLASAQRRDKGKGSK